MSKNKKSDFILSDSNQTNSHGFRIKLESGRYERFKANPVMLYNHNSNNVIGRWENFRYEDGKLKATPVFDLKDEEGAKVARKVEDGFLRGASVGIRPISMQEIGDEYILTDFELVEASVTPIPSDAGALRLYNDKRELITFDAFKLSFNNKNQFKMNEPKITLSQVSCKSLGLQDNYTSKDVELAVAEKDTQIEKLQKQVDEQHIASVNLFMENAFKAGKINETERKAYEELSTTADGFAKIQDIVNSKSETPTASLSAMTTQSTASAGREGWTYLEWMQKDPKGLSQMRQENPKQFEQLQLTLKK